MDLHFSTQVSNNPVGERQTLLLHDIYKENNEVLLQLHIQKQICNDWYIYNAKAKTIQFLYYLSLHNKFSIVSGLKQQTFITL